MVYCTPQDFASEKFLFVFVLLKLDIFGIPNKIPKRMNENLKNEI